MTIEFWMGSMVGMLVTAVLFLIGYLIELHHNLQEMPLGSQPLSSEEGQETLFSNWKAKTTDSP